MKIIITRHGETEENKAGIIQGQLPGSLSAEGIMQAKKVALRLKNEKIDYIYSSDLTRAHNTALEIRKYHQNIPLILSEDLRERYFGELQGRYFVELQGKNEKGISFNTISGNNIETNENLLERAKIFLDKIDKKYGDKNLTILFVGHNGINRAIISKLLNKDFKQIENLQNTNISIFEKGDNGNFKMSLFNCAKHLEDS
ncbi:histidine phosphatase family protein [Candidatus Gracilibacteria bacterium]|nr:histidine phosphatase family protein [Candidatus Gracilibacteria bacterium]NUJ99480.1 histidine phosphatase family protein [Candidatus Gracilibacteria bacterium]